jgi:uncharacterized damage-inducible protein DinB
MTTQLANTLLEEIEHELVATGKLLDRLPESRLGWRPHPKSMSLGQLALHVATIPAGIAASLEAGGAEAADLLTHPAAESVAGIQAAWGRTMAYLRQNPIAANDGEWSVRHAGRVVMTLPKATVSRFLMLNHWYHHRGQLTVYLRLLDVPLPAVYVASADENPFA